MNKDSFLVLKKWQMVKIVTWIESGQQNIIMTWITVVINNSRANDISHGPCMTLTCTISLLANNSNNKTVIFLAQRPRKEGEGVSDDNYVRLWRDDSSIVISHYCVVPR